jgi:hypothetical protein
LSCLPCLLCLKGMSAMKTTVLPILPDGQLLGSLASSLAPELRYSQGALPFPVCKAPVRLALHAREYPRWCVDLCQSPRLHQESLDVWLCQTGSCQSPAQPSLCNETLHKIIACPHAAVPLPIMAFVRK